MRERVFVISDLHLGGEPGFQMVPPAGQTCLAAFIRRVTGQHSTERAAHLVLAGDLVDFLAETPFAALTTDEGEAVRKLSRILADTAEIWDALAAHVQAGAPLSLLLGNHDIELSLPGPRRLLLDRLGHGSVQFLDDDRAWVRGPLLIEHGNRYDGWNVVDHDGLRRLRAALSRREEAPAITVQPGSEMVATLMNPLKRKYSFIDLLKPETETVPPLLALLEPALLSDLRRMYELARLGLRADQAQGTRDLSSPGASATPAKSARLQALTESLASSAVAAGRASDDGSHGSQATGEAGSRGLSEIVDFASMWLSARTSSTRSAPLLRRLRTALVAQAGSAIQALHTAYEQDCYLDAARASAQRGFQVVIYGHTHLAKRVDLGGALYLNTGTWADLMTLPAHTLDLAADEPLVLSELAEFADDLAHNRLDRYRRRLASFACVDLSADLRIESADIFRFTDPGEAAPIPEGVLNFDGTA